MYGKKLYGANRQLLHAHTIAFCHPITGKALEIKARVPEDMSHFIELIKNESGNPES